MIKYSIITLFPALLETFRQTSILKRAQEQKLLKIEIIDLRQFGEGKHQQVDDYNYGGGSGMVLQIAPLVKAIRSVQTEKSLVCLMTPQGQTFDQKVARGLLDCHQHFIFVCGRYEGFDERIYHYVDKTISIGDYVLNGGEIPTMAVIETLSRLVPQVIRQTSIAHDSFNNNLLDYPLYAPPVVFEEHTIPDVVRSGHHKEITSWRSRMQVSKTWQYRPDLLKKAHLTVDQKRWLTSLQTTKGTKDNEF